MEKRQRSWLRSGDPADRLVVAVTGELMPMMRVGVARMRVRVVIHLGGEAGKRFADERASEPGVLLQLVPGQPRVWSLADILPTS